MLCFLSDLRTTEMILGPLFAALRHAPRETLRTLLRREEMNSAARPENHCNKYCLDATKRPLRRDRPEASPPPTTVRRPAARGRPGGATMAADHFITRRVSRHLDHREPLSAAAPCPPRKAALLPPPRRFHHSAKCGRHGRGIFV